MIHRLLAALCLGLLLAQPSSAGGPRSLGDAVRIELRPGWREGDGRHVAALSVRLAPGWKTYWRVSGRLGIAPRLDWRGSGNVRSVTPVWPRPRPIAQPGGRAIGYDGDLTLPLVVEPRDPALPMRLRGALDLGVCSDVCLPVKARVDAVLPPAGAPDPAIRAALADRPGTVVGAVRCRLVPDEAGLAIEVEVEAPPLGAPEAAVIEMPGAGLWIDDPAVARRGDEVRATAAVADPDGGPVAFDRRSLRVTLIGSERAVEATGCDGG